MASFLGTALEYLYPCPKFRGAGVAMFVRNFQTRVSFRKVLGQQQIGGARCFEKIQQRMPHAVSVAKREFIARITRSLINAMKSSGGNVHFLFHPISSS